MEPPTPPTVARQPPPGVAPPSPGLSQPSPSSLPAFSASPSQLNPAIDHIHHQPIRPGQTTTEDHHHRTTFGHGEEELSYDYVSEPNENLVCPICRNPFIDPVMCDSMDHVFCSKCLIKCLETSSTCPIDRQPLSLSLVSPAPKIIFKLVDELLVVCPFKSKLNCPFVCQRDLMGVHARTHASQLASEDTRLEKLISQPGNTPFSVNSPSQPSRTLDHPSHITSPLDLMRFQLRSNRATLIEKPSGQTPSPLDPQTSHSYQTDLKPCPLERFGCSFVGMPKMLNQHLSITSDQLGPSDGSKCPFYSVQEILYWFERLEIRNIELNHELSRSVAQRSELASALESLQSSFRRLRQSLQTSDLDPSSLYSSLGNVVPFYQNAPAHTSMSVGMDTPRAIAFAQSCSDNSRQMSRSCLNYDSLSGQRISHLFHHSNSPGRRAPYYISPLPSPSLMSQPNMRVSTFLRRGEILTRKTDTFSGISPTSGFTLASASNQTSPAPEPIKQALQGLSPQSPNDPSSPVDSKIVEAVELLEETLKVWEPFHVVGSSPSKTSAITGSFPSQNATARKTISKNILSSSEMRALD